MGGARLSGTQLRYVVPLSSQLLGPAAESRGMDAPDAFLTAIAHCGESLRTAQNSDKQAAGRKPTRPPF